MNVRRRPGRVLLEVDRTGAGAVYQCAICHRYRVRLAARAGREIGAGQAAAAARLSAEMIRGHLEREHGIKLTDDELAELANDGS